MSFQAQTWAVGVKAGSVIGKAILLELANIADENGSCLPDEASIAASIECEQVDVRRWLSVLERRGLINRGSADCRIRLALGTTTL